MNKNQNGLFHLLNAEFRIPYRCIKIDDNSNQIPNNIAWNLWPSSAALHHIYDGDINASFVL